MSTIDAAIIKALVEHIGGDSSGIPDGTIGGGATYTEGDGINIVNDQISVEYDPNSMELKDGKLAAKTQLTVGDGLTTTNGKITANLDTNTMQMSSGKISAKTQLAAGTGISISSGKVNVNYDTDTMKLVDGKLAFKADANTLTTLGYRANLEYSVNTSSQLCIPMETPGQIPLGSIIRVQYMTTKNTYMIVGKEGDNYLMVNLLNPKTTIQLFYVSDKKWYTSSGMYHSGDVSDEFGLFYRGIAAYTNPNGTEVVPATEYNAMIQYILSKLSA